MKFSVVICTYNRADSLEKTLRGLLFQDHDDFEVIVVNGPSTDHTERMLSGWVDKVRRVKCPVPNLSVSRNLGASASVGDVVAFIDDDAIPEGNWLSDLESAYQQDSEVAAVGGLVWDRTGAHLQYRFAVCDRLGACRTVSAAEAPTERPRRGIFRPVGLVASQEVAGLPRRPIG